MKTTLPPFAIKPSPSMFPGKKLRAKLVVPLALAALFAMMQPATAGSYTWNVTSGNWSDPASWSPTPGAGGPLNADTVIFGNTGASTDPTTVNNTVDASFAGAVLNFTNGSFGSSTYLYPVTQIPSGKTLTISNQMFIGGVNLGSSTPPYATYQYMVGGGTLKIVGPSLIVQNYGSAAGANNCAYLNLSGLTNFVFNNPNGTIVMAGYVPPNYASGSQGTRQGGSMILAANSNNITASAINLGTSGVAQAGPSGQLASGVASLLTLGSGTNIINVGNFNISAQKNPFTVTNSGGGLRIRGITGADSDNNANITIGNRNVTGGSGTTTGSLLLNGCAVNISANSLIVGECVAGQPNGSGHAGNGFLAFDNGTISANSLQMAYNLGSNNGSGLAQANGTIQVGANGTFLIGAGQLFALATAAGTGPASGTLIVSNGLINCQGPIVMGPNANSVPPSGLGSATGTIQLIGAGTLNMGLNSYIGAITNPVTTLILDTNSTLSLSVPSASYTNICVDNLSWPSDDADLTISLAAVPAGITNNEVFAFLNFTNMTGGTFNNPRLVLPPGVTGNLSLPGGGNTIYLTLTGGVGAGVGGVNQLLNPFFSLSPLGTNWTAIGAASVISTNSVYPNTGACTVDTRNIVALSGTTNVAKLTGSFVAGGSTNVWSQSVPVVAGSEITAGAQTYVAHEDIMSGADSFYYELDFLDTNGTLVAAYESSVLSNLDCGSPILDTWDLMAITNQMQVVGGVNTGVVISNVAPVFLVPPQSVNARFKAVFIQRNASDTGSVYFSGANFGLLANPVPPSVGPVTPNLVTLCTNKFLTCTATSTITTISSVQVIATTATLGGIGTTTTTYNMLSPELTVAGLGTSSASISLALATNTIYQSVVVQVTDADNLTVSSTPVSFDTLTPNLVIEAADFNYSNGQFMDTPPNGGFALYQGKVGTQDIDENKVGRTGETQSYYRPSDAVIMQAAAPNTGNPPSGTEQKFVTAAANGDTTNIEVEVGFNSPGDWLNYSRTFGSGGSAPSGTYNVWCYLATSGSGSQATFSRVTSDPMTTGQLTTFLGTFGTSAFSDASYNTFKYVPLVDQFGNRVTVTVTNGINTFKSTVSTGGNPNLGFYMFVPVAPVYNPVFLNIYPNSTFEPTNQFTFSVGPAQGDAISTNGIGLIINGIPVTSGLVFTSISDGGWTVNYPIQSNQMYSVIINVTNMSGLTANYTNRFDTFDINNYHWMAVDYDFSTNNGTSSGGSIGDGWTGGLFIDNPIPTGDTNAPTNSQFWELQTNSYFGYPTGFGPSFGPLGGDTLAGLGAVAHQGVDINWPTNATQDPGGTISNSIYRLSSVYVGGAAEVNGGDGVGSQVASDSFLLPEFLFARTNNVSGSPDPAICEFNVGYFYSNNWLNYTRTFPTGKFEIWGRLASGGGAFSGCTLSKVTSGMGTSNQTTQVLGSFSDPAPGGWQSYKWIQLLDTNGSPVYVQFNGKATLRLTAPTNASPSGGGLNPLFFMLAPVPPAASAFNIAASNVNGNIQISIPTQSGHNYILLYSASLSPASWTQIGGSIMGDGTIHVISQSSSGSGGFYRVEAQ